MKQTEITGWCYNSWEDRKEKLTTEAIIDFIVQNTDMDHETAVTKLSHTNSVNPIKVNQYEFYLERK